MVNSRFFGLLFVLVLVLVLAAPVDAQPRVDRGSYFKGEDPAIEMWIPRGFRRVEDPKDKAATAVFLGWAGSVSQIDIRESQVSELSQFVEANRNGVERQYPGCSVRVLDSEKIGNHEVVFLVVTDIEEKKSTRKMERVFAGTDLGGDLILGVSLFLQKGGSEKALELLRGMLGTLKRPGASGLDPFLQDRHLDKETGLSFRPPRGHRPIDPKEGDSFVFRAERRDTGVRLTLARAADPAVDKILKAETKGLKRIGRPWTCPHDGDCRPLAGLYVTDDENRARVVIAIGFKETHFFSVQVEGPYEACDALTRTAELMAMSLNHVDIEAARADAEAAVLALNAARKQRRKGEVAAQVEVLTRYPYVNAAAAALAKALTAIDDEKTQVKVADALANAEAEIVLPDLIKAVRFFKSRKRPAVVTALLKSLGSVRGTKAVFVLQEFAKRGDDAQSAAAIRSLGRYKIKRERILKNLVNLMARDESAARKSDFNARERWLKLKPAYQEALNRMTGETFRSTAEAKAWLRKK